MRHYTVNEAADQLAGAFPNLTSREWSQKIIRAILDEKLIGTQNGLPLIIREPHSAERLPGAVVAAVVCALYADDLNAWLRGKYRFEENEAVPDVVARENKADSTSDKETQRNDIIGRAKEIAQEVSNHQWTHLGYREITIRGIASDVAKRLETEGYRGQRGPYSEGSVRNFLSGWIYSPSAEAQN